MSLLDVQHLRKSYGAHRAVDDLSFTVEAGDVLGLLGPNGAGKTTAMLMIAGLLTPDAGTIRLNGEPFNPRSLAMKPLLGVVPQDLAIYPDLTAYENLNFFGRLYGLRGRKLRERIAEVLDWIGLTHSAHNRAGEFSGGMKRRLNFGVALLHEPRLLILDEPTVGVDPQSRSHLLDCVRELARRNVGIIYASHYMEEVQSICQRAAIIDHGKMLAYDSVAKLLDGLESDLYLHVTDASRLNGELHGLARVQRTTEEEAAVIISGHERDMNQSLARVLQILNTAGVQVRRIEMQEANLERLFLQLTGHRLRD